VREAIAKDEDAPRFVVRKQQQFFDKLAPDIKIEALEFMEGTLGVAHHRIPPPPPDAAPPPCGALGLCFT